MNLRDREYWTPRETAAVLGRSASYWVKAIDDGLVRGYSERGRRYIQAESARAWLARLVDQTATTSESEKGIHIFLNARRRRIAS